MSETIYQWAIRTANERRVEALPKPVIHKKKHRHFVPIDYGYFRWGSANKDYVEKIRTAYQWGIKNNKTKQETAKKFNTSENNLWQYAQNNKLPKLKAQ